MPDVETIQMHQLIFQFDEFNTKNRYFILSADAVHLPVALRVCFAYSVRIYWWQVFSTVLVVGLYNFKCKLRVMVLL